jgi:hypothetical protein
MKMTRNQFMELTRNRSIPTDALQQSRDFDPERVRHLVVADLDGDGSIRGRREMRQLSAQLSRLSGSADTSEINVSRQHDNLLGVLQDVAGREGVRRSVAAPAAGETTTTAAPSETARSRGPSQVQPDRKSALIGQLVRAGGSATDEDVAVSAERLQQMPVAALERMAARGASVVAARGSVTDHLTELRGVQPRGYPPGRTWDDVQGGYHSGTREAVIATTERNGRRVIGERASADVVLHEAGHAYDHAMGRPSTNDAAFVAAREQDLDALQRLHSTYFTQPGDAGRSETYAESMAMFFADPNRLQRRLPNLYNYWAQQFPNQ